MAVIWRKNAHDEKTYATHLVQILIKYKYKYFAKVSGGSHFTFKNFFFSQTFNSHCKFFISYSDLASFSDSYTIKFRKTRGGH